MPNKIPATICNTEDIYKPLESTEGWLKCHVCGEYPKVWIFDNGNFAKCRCMGQYEKVFTTSIIECYFRQNKSYDGYKHLLRDAWNARCNSILFKMWRMWLEKNNA